MKGEIALISLIVILIASSQSSKIVTDLDPPIWPEHFSISIFEQPTADHQFYTTGQIWVNYNKNNMRIQKNNSLHDPFCQAVISNVSIPCTQLTNSGTKYIIFPTKNMCCQCCNIGNPNCQFTKRDWLSNSTFNGSLIINWQVYNKWNLMMGNTPFFYIQSADGQRIPKQFAKSDLSYAINFYGPYNTSEVPDAIFQVPAYCNKKCPKSGACPNDGFEQVIAEFE